MLLHLGDDISFGGVGILLQILSELFPRFHHGRVELFSLLVSEIEVMSETLQFRRDLLALFRSDGHGNSFGCELCVVFGTDATRRAEMSRVVRLWDLIVPCRVKGGRLRLMQPSLGVVSDLQEAANWLPA